VHRPNSQPPDSPGRIHNSNSTPVPDEAPIWVATSSLGNNPSSPDERRAIVSSEANLGRPSKEDFGSMARRRFQDPKPTRRGNPLKLINRTA